MQQSMDENHNPENSKKDLLTNWKLVWELLQFTKVLRHSRGLKFGETRQQVWHWPTAKYHGCKALIKISDSVA